jgi:ferrochelatase
MKQTAVMLLNMGGPDSLEAVRPFLYNLFSDRDIIRLGPSFLQKPLAWLISTLRAKKSRNYYQLIGGASPLKAITQQQAAALQTALGQDYRVYVGMRYWHPFIADTIRQIEQDGVKRIIAFSLYPHYSKATTGSTLSAFERHIQGKGFEVCYIKAWYDFPLYIESLAETIQQGLASFGDSDVDVLFSAHSLPEYFITEGDPYLSHTQATIAEICKIIPLRWHLSFQSRSGPVKWLSPSTDEMIRTLAKQGCKRLLVAPISFISDHIETLYELDILYKSQAVELGIDFKRCKALNVNDKFIQALKSLAQNAC